MAGEEDRLRTDPVLDAKAPRVGRAPVEPERVDGRRAAEVEEDPLRMVRVALARVAAVEVWVALPERARRAVVEPRVARVIRLVDRVAAPWEAVPVAHVDAAPGP